MTIAPAVHPRTADNGPLERELDALAAELGHDDDYQQRLGALFRRWLKRNPHDGSSLMLPFAGRSSEIMAGLALSSAWAEIDARSAFAWLRGQPDSAARQSYYEAAGTVLGGLDPAEAIAQADGMDEGWNRREYLKAVVIGWEEKDFTAALTWADRLKPGPEREEVLIPLLFGWAQRDPMSAMSYVSKGIPPGRFQDDAACNVAAHWLNSDPLAVSAWVGEMPAGDLRNKLGLMVRDQQEYVIRMARAGSEKPGREDSQKH